MRTVLLTLLVELIVLVVIAGLIGWAVVEMTCAALPPRPAWRLGASAALRPLPPEPVPLIGLLDGPMATPGEFAEEAPR